MATAAAFTYNVKDTSVSTVVPDDDIAHLMYYLNCVTKGVGLDILQDDLIEYQRYNFLSPLRIAVVFKTAVELSPDELIGKLIFRDDEHDLIPRNMNNTFISINTACNIVSIQRDILISGKVQDVSKVMFFTSNWLELHYTKPIERIARAVLGTKHCNHCEGESGLCSCTACPRGAESKCQPLFDALLDAFIQPTRAQPTRAASPKPPPGQHQCNCDGCGKSCFYGTRYKCSTCDDYDLCANCYEARIHSAHPFMQIIAPGSKPNHLPARYKPPVAPTIPTRSPPAPAPPPYTPSPYSGTGRDGSDDSSHKSSSSPFFYNSMSISELRAFLRDHGVSSDGILDKETLCKHVWETHCDSMSMIEVNKFLMDNKISTADCRDIPSRRQKAKDAFAPPSRPLPPPTSVNTSATRFRKDDSVILKGLTRAEMNGKRGTVMSVDQAANRVQVRVFDMDKTFKVKFENIEIEEEDEELE
ncbi:hypothetical protein CPB83DRAFT_849028 [Crepidotus variabilis]|uniref:ZZ-type domain-containing protein n=1 Tax=Crepidotus variabilis TaxID=179855 RepID=A0A9P6ELV2_9AGAR|nr:hypothetical protein CPB83DRAFT_849028 [Crepidotus variabilis]